MAQSGELAAEILGYQPVILGDCDAQTLHQVLPTWIGYLRGRPKEDNASLMKGSGGKHWGAEKMPYIPPRKGLTFLSVASLCTAWIADAVDTHGNI